MTLKFRWETEFKQTELGYNIPLDWEEKRVGKIIELKYGKGLPEKERKAGKTPVFGSSGLIGYCSKSYAHGPGVIIGRKGNVGSIYFSISDFYPIDTVFYSENVINAVFLFYLISKIDLKQMMSDSAVPGININFIKSIRIPFPELIEQMRISNLLTWFDELIENKKRQNKILEDTALALFRSWFIKIDPFKGKKLKETELGRIPNSWDLKPIGKLATLKNGISYSGKEKFEEQIDGSKVFITLNNAIEGGGFKPVYAWIKSDRIKEHQLLKEGDLIFPNTEQTKDERLIGSPGIVFFPYDYEQGKGVFSHHITKVNVHDSRYAFYLYCFLKATREDSASFTTGTGVLGLDLKNFGKNKMVIDPGHTILEKFDNFVEPLFNKIIINQKQIMLLRKIRDTLLPLLVFGKLRVEEI